MDTFRVAPVALVGPVLCRVVVPDGDPGVYEEPAWIRISGETHGVPCVVHLFRLDLADETRLYPGATKEAKRAWSALTRAFAPDGRFETVRVINREGRWVLFTAPWPVLEDDDG